MSIRHALKQSYLANIRRVGPLANTIAIGQTGKIGLPLDFMKSWHRANSFLMALASKSPPNQSENHGPHTPSPSSKHSPSTNYDQEYLDPKDSRKRKCVGNANATPCPSSYQTIDSDTTNISEAQSRGFYRSPGCPAPKLKYVGGYPLNVDSGDEDTEHSSKRIRGAEEETESRVVTTPDNSLPQRNLEVVIPDRRGSARASGESPIPPSTAPSESPPRDPRLRDPSSQTPAERSTDDVGDATIASMDKFAEEQRIRRQELKESSQKHLERMKNLERGWEARIRQRRLEAETARKAVQEKQDADYERREAELSRHWMLIEEKD